MIDQTLTDALQDQFNRERENESLYSAIADVLASRYWPGFERWFRRQATDEADHAKRIARYLVDQNRVPEYQALPAPEFTPGEPDALFFQALQREKQTTAEIDQIYHLAEIEESPATCEFMLWFVKEQVEEEKTITDLLQALTRADCSAALLMLDREQLKD